MTMTEPAPLATARDFPDQVPVLLDAASGVSLRALSIEDLQGVVEICRDPEMVRWTTSLPARDYERSDAEAFRQRVAEGWRSGRRLSWAVSVEEAGVRRYAGNVSLRLDGDGLAEVGFSLHPAVRGRSIMSTAVRLVRDYGFDVVGLEAIRWRAIAGNWSSRHVAGAAGFVFDGTVRRLLVQRGELRDGWVATITRDDPRTPQPRFRPVELLGDRVRLRPFTVDDTARIVDGCSDERTRHWLVSLPHPYTATDAASFINATQELASAGAGMVWCIADRTDDRCLGSISLEGLGGYSQRAEIGYWAHPEARGRGVVTAAVRLATAHAESTGLTDSIMIRCAGRNVASRHVAEAAGYRQIGVQAASEPLGDGSLDDLVMYTRP